jgi:hypothetical protein
VGIPLKAHRRGSRPAEALSRRLLRRRSYVESMYRQFDQDKVIAEYRASHDENPNDSRFTYLLGIALMGGQPPESLKPIESALAKSPQFPLAPHATRKHLQYARLSEQRRHQAGTGLYRRLSQCLGRLQAVCRHRRQEGASVLCGEAARIAPGAHR